MISCIALELTDHTVNNWINCPIIHEKFKILFNVTKKTQTTPNPPPKQKTTNKQNTPPLTTKTNQTQQWQCVERETKTNDWHLDLKQHVKNSDTTSPIVCGYLNLTHY